MNDFKYFLHFNFMLRFRMVNVWPVTLIFFNRHSGHSYWMTTINRCSATASVFRTKLPVLKFWPRRIKPSTWSISQLLSCPQIFLSFRAENSLEKLKVQGILNLNEGKTQPGYSWTQNPDLMSSELNESDWESNYVQTPHWNNKQPVTNV